MAVLVNPININNKTNEVIHTCCIIKYGELRQEQYIKHISYYF